MRIVGSDDALLSPSISLVQSIVGSDSARLTPSTLKPGLE